MSQYDPDAPEGSRPSASQYMSIKDIRIIAVVLVLLFFIAMPIYQRMKRERDDKLCQGNIQRVAKATLLYADGQDMRFPPAFAEDPGAPGVPKLEGEIPITWVTAVSQMMEAGSDFGCPVADPLEHAMNVAPNGGDPIPSAFGITAGMVTQPIMMLDAPTTTVFLAETANNGAKNTYNPEPFMLPSGREVKYDGYLIGYDNPGGNKAPDMSVHAMTRLAFYDTADGEFVDSEVKSRREHGLFVIFADGHLGKINRSDARVKLLHDQPQGLWRAK